MSEKILSPIYGKETIRDEGLAHVAALAGKPTRDDIHEKKYLSIKNAAGKVVGYLPRTEKLATETDLAIHEQMAEESEERAEKDYEKYAKANGVEIIKSEVAGLQKLYSAGNEANQEKLKIELKNKENIEIQKKEAENESLEKRTAELKKVVEDVVESRWIPEIRAAAKRGESSKTFRVMEFEHHHYSGGVRHINKTPIDDGENASIHKDEFGIWGKVG